MGIVYFEEFGQASTNTNDTRVILQFPDRN